MLVALAEQLHLWPAVITCTVAELRANLAVAAAAVDAAAALDKTIMLLPYVLL